MDLGREKGMCDGMNDECEGGWMTDLIKHNIHEKSGKTRSIAFCDCFH